MPVTGSGVATGKSSNGLNRALASPGLKGYFHATRTADQTFSKPDPAMLLELMDELAVSAERTLMIGDTTHDLQMAQNAGVDAVAMGYGAHRRNNCVNRTRSHWCDDFAELRDMVQDQCLTEVYYKE